MCIMLKHVPVLISDCECVYLREYQIVFECPTVNICVNIHDPVSFKFIQCVQTAMPASNNLITVGDSVLTINHQHSLNIKVHK